MNILTYKIGYEVVTLQIDPLILIVAQTPHLDLVGLMVRLTFTF